MKEGPVSFSVGGVFGQDIPEPSLVQVKTRIYMNMRAMAVT